jgi:predicted porin
MKKNLLALAVVGAFAGVAHAQTAVVIYGNIDAGFTKQTDQTLQIGKRASNTLGFKGTEELGSGLKALFQLEMRYEPDTGTVEGNSRPLFQGQSRVGLEGDFGMVRIGRGLTAFQESNQAFEPWHGLPTPVGFYTDLSVAGYNSDPLGLPGNSRNRFSNAIWYNSKDVNGFQFNGTLATKEAQGAGPAATTTPYSFAGTYKNGPFAFMLAAERNAAAERVASVAGYVMASPDLKLMLSYTRQNQDSTKAFQPVTKAFVLGANYTMGAGKFLAGYGQKQPDGARKVKQMSLGYEYSLSKRTYVYADASRKQGVVSDMAVKTYSLGINHAF